MKKDESKTKWPWAVKAVVFVAFIIMIIGIGFLIHDFCLANEVTKNDIWTTRGTMGDFYGGHLAGFGTIAAFLLMFAAIGLQSNELKLQRLEYKESREIFKVQKDIQERQSKLMEEFYEKNYLLSLIQTMHNLKTQAKRDTSGGIEGTLLEDYFKMLDLFAQYLYTLDEPNKYINIARAALLDDWSNKRSKEDEQYPEAFRLIDTIRESVGTSVLLMVGGPEA